MKRRDFLKRSVQTGAILPLAGSGLFARPLPLAARQVVDGLENRILVLINLNGGNDGLNMVVPYADPIYHNSRPSIALGEQNVLKLESDLGFHPQMTGLRNRYLVGELAVVNNVGYPDQNRSHFRSTDIWHSASDESELLYTGWVGRYLQNAHPDYPDVLPDAPFALQISTATSLALLADKGNMGIALDNPDRFYRLANGLTPVDSPVPATHAGPELEFVRSVIAQSDRYSRSIDDAITIGENHRSYQSDFLSRQLQLVARLIDGGLTTRIYIVSLGGFDTHANELQAHSLLLGYLSNGLDTFMGDISDGGNADRVSFMTYSEFGRRLEENGSAGTDHGAASPQLVGGSMVNGGKMFGGNPDLANLDERGDIRYSVDFRQIYASVLGQWLGVTSSGVDQVLEGTFEQLPLFRTTTSIQESSDLSVGLNVVWNGSSDEIEIKLTGYEKRPTDIRLLSVDGTCLRVWKEFTEQSRSLILPCSRLASGIYFVQIQIGQKVEARKIVVRR